MSAKTIIILGLKVIALAIILCLCFMVASIVSGVSTPPADAEPAPSDVGASMFPLVVFSLLVTVVFTYIILRSRWTGWKLVGAIFIAFFGLMTVLAQIESAIYLTHILQPGMVQKFFLMGAVVAVLYSPLAVLILGRMRRELAPQARNLRLVMPPVEWVWKLAVIAAAYVILYYVFGYFIAWKNPAVRAYYGGTDPGNFFAQMSGIWASKPWMFPFQAFRGMLWTAFTLPVIRMLKGRQWEVGMAVAFLFAVWSSLLLLPNPYMPEVVRKAHLIETVLSNFIFGWLVGWLLNRHHSSLRDLFKWSEGLE